MMKRSAMAMGLAAMATLLWGCAADVDDSGSTDTANNQHQTDTCWADFGPDAPGECMIGDERVCPGTDPTSVDMYCRDKCVNIDGKAVWGLQTHDFQCPFYDTNYHIGTAPECLCNTPLVLSFDNASVQFTSESGAAFDLTGTGVCHGSDWPTSTTPWLALDRNNDGKIRDGNELFGSATRLDNGALAKNGFEALRDLDADHNEIFDARDPAFANVMIWTDANLNRESETNELMSVANAGVRTIDLHNTREKHCDARGNCEGERSMFEFVDATGNTRRGTVIDVYLSTK